MPDSMTSFGNGMTIFRDGRGRLVELFLNKRTRTDNEDLAFIELTVAPRSSRDLVHFAGRERSPLNTVEFCRFAEDDALDGETHAHTDGVCRHHNARLARREFPNLFAAGRRRQRTIDDACFDMVLFL